MADEPARGHERAARLRREGRLDAAIAACREALALEPGDGEAWNELAHTLRWRGQLSEAREAAATAVRLAPELAAAWFNLGAVLVEQGQATEGIAAYRKALALQPDFAEAWSNLGGALAMQGDAVGEIAAYRRALESNPGLALVWSNLADALRESGNVEEAVAAARRALAIDPELSAGWVNLANALREAGNILAALEAAQQATRAGPGLAAAWGSLGNALEAAERYEEGLAAHRAALERAPGDARLHFNVGVALRRLGRSTEAVDCYRRALAIDPADAETHWNLGLALLTLGELAEGWEEYEWRWRRRQAEARRYDFTPWDGDTGAQRRLLLWGEQGVGDQIIYAGMIPDLAATRLHVAVEVDARLAPLFERSFPGIAVHARQEPPALRAADHDAQLPFASLGRFLRRSFASFPRRPAYLRADPARAASLRERLRTAAQGTNRIVGISWRSANPETGQFKSLALLDALPILAVPGCTFVDLQYGDTAAERAALAREHGIRIEHLPDLDLFNDLDGLVALCSACDLVITASNVTAHAAGATGTPVWLVNPRARGRIWYWFSGRRDSPWYPSMRIFEQTAPGDWQEVVDTVARELAALATGRS